MTEKRDIVERLEIVARRMDSTIARGEPAMLGTKHPEEVREAAAEIIRLRASLAAAPDMAEALEKLITTAAVLLQNAEGCAMNHYGEDFRIHGPPGWLADCDNTIQSARAALAKAKGEA